ncbi:uncharacterized protein LOC107992642 [Apis cerana]|uniref:uncharacterized protein LOC107992642 n=1 Tax=Apis cerana TaxID=7461 RepID=UPI0007E2DBDA|nr:uncharacterized protein LOC107992642 [Apis cerana]
MNRRIASLIVSLALVLAVRSDEKLKCYMCTSLTDPSCDTDLSTEDIKECTLNNMDSFKQRIQQHNDLNKISVIFDVDKSQYYQASAPMACAKMILKVNNRDVTVRTCQTAKTETIDPCKAIEGKVTNNIHDLQSCQLCEQDACNGSISVSPRILLPLLSIIGAMAFASFYKTA